MNNMVHTVNPMLSLGKLTSWWQLWPCYCQDLWLRLSL